MKKNRTYGSLEDIGLLKMIKMIRYTIFILLLSLSQAFAVNSYSQQTKLTLEMKNASLEDVFDRIEKNSEFFFLYNKNIIDVKRKVDINVEGISINQVLDKLLDKTDISYQIKDRQILLINNYMQGEIIESSTQQQKSVSGKVIDSSGASLPGVSVVVKGTTTGVITDTNGNYTLSKIPENAILKFSFVGMKTEEVVIGNKTIINFTLEEADNTLDEIVAVGYGTQKKVNVTGSVTTLKTGSLVNATPTVLSNGLAGRLPGLIVVQGNGAPGSGSELSIRGASTFGDNTVLIVVDGIVRDNAFDEIDPNDVESLSILKDAAATSVYGSRAANGVILVTTKRGSMGKPKFSYNSFVGTQEPTVYPKLMNSYQYATLRNAGYKNSKKRPPFSEEQLADFASGKAGSDHFGLAFKERALQTQHNINVSGGTDALKYFSSLSYLDQGGLYDALNYKRYSLRSNVDAKINSTLTISTDLNANFQQKNGSGWSIYQIFNDVLQADPTVNYLNPDGSINYKSSYGPAFTKYGYSKDASSVLQATLSFKQDLPFIKGLNLTGKATFGEEYTNNKNYMLPIPVYNGSYQGSMSLFGGYNGKTAVSVGSDNYSTTQYTLNLNYNRTFGNHQVTGLLLFEQFDATGSNVYGFRTNYAANGLDELNFGGQEQKDANGGSFTDGRQSYVVRGNYDYKGRYLFETSLRIDGSVAFPVTKKFGYFPAFSAGWRIGQEPFLKDNSGLSFIDDLKIRASYGEVGSDRNVYSGRVPSFQYLQVYENGGTLISGTSPLLSVAPGVLPNPTITWESAAISNLGIDGSFWKSKFKFEIDLFYKRTSDILMSRIRSIPGTLGAELPDENYAVVDNKGIEMSFTHNNNIGKLKLFVNVNGSFSRNEVITLDEPANIPEYLLQTGRPLGFITGYKAIGYFQTPEDVANYYPQFNGGQVPGNVKYADVNGDHVVDSNDKTVISMDNGTPKIMGGLSFGGSYGSFDFDVLFQGAAKVKLLLYSGARSFNLRSGGNNFVDMLDFWTPENPDAKYPAPFFLTQDADAFDSNLYLRDASYIRLKAVNFGYNLPKGLLKSIHVEKFRLYFSGTNLMVWDKGLMFDPEVSNGSGNYYPQQRTYNLGINLTF